MATETLAERTEKEKNKKQRRWDTHFYRFPEPHKPVPMGPPCYLDVAEDEKLLGRIVIQPRDDIVPYTCDNFRAFIRGYKDGDTTYTYKDTPFHRIIKDFIVQTGDAEYTDGTGDKTIYGDTFQDENFDLVHEPYTVSMSNTGRNSNGCIFFILQMEAPWMDGTYVVFGKVTAGFETIAHMNSNSRKSGRMFKYYKIMDCGELLAST